MHRVLFELGPVRLYTYGFFAAAGFLAATFLILRNADSYDIPKDDIFDCIIAVMIGGLIGGRLLFVALNWQDYFFQPLRIFKLYEGGLAFQGAVLVGAFSGWIMTRVKKISFLKAADLISPYIALGQSLGRIGCFFNGCCYGKESYGGLCVAFPGESVLRVPAQLYASLAYLMLFVLLSMLRKRSPFNGYMFSLYLIFYPLTRFFLDFLRGDDLIMIMGFTISQVFSLIILIVGIGFYIVLGKRSRV